MTLTRRDFTVLGASAFAAAAASPLSAVRAADRQIGYALIGLGRISSHFGDGIKNTRTTKVTALVSGHRDKAEKWAEIYGVPKSSIYSYENFDSIKDNKNVDAVYIGLPNSMHADFTIRAAKAGKHVLCEKPMATSVDDAEAMIKACNAAKVKLMIAYRLHYEPTNLKAVKLIREGAIGKIQSIESAFGFDCNASDWRLDRKLGGGGPLLDVGIYCLNASRYLTGEEPVSFQAIATQDTSDARFKDIESTIAWETKFPSGAVASCSTTYNGSMDGFFRVHGTLGQIEASPAYNYDGLRLKARYQTPSGPVEIDEFNPEKDPLQFQRQAEHFADCIVQNKTPTTPGEEGLRDMKYMRDIYKAAGLRNL